MKHIIAASFLAIFGTGALFAQSGVPTDAPAEDATLRLTSRAVLVDVLVTDSNGRPITGLKQDAFTVLEDGKPQVVAYFEEHESKPPAPVAMPQMPPDVFSNFSPYPQPDVVNVLLLDSLNTRMDDQSNAHNQIMKFLKSAKPGTRTAIFTMGLELHFIQGFNDDPAILAAALKNKKNIEVETPMMLEAQDETNAQSKIPSMAGFFAEQIKSRTIDREFRTLANLQKLAAFLQGFPGRKNIIWFTEKAPGEFLKGGETGNPALDDEIKKTNAMLSTVRAALYPLDASGTSVNAQYTAENNPWVVSKEGKAIKSDDEDRNHDQLNAQLLAEQTGGRSFTNINDLSGVIDKVTADSSHFYTLSYSPANPKMDGSFRKIGVKVASGKYSLSYRRGYFAVATVFPDVLANVRNQKRQNVDAESSGAIDPLLPFMDLGMPQSEQILYKIQIVPTAAAENESAQNKDKNHYRIDFTIDLNDLSLKSDTDRRRKGALNISLMIYDRYANTISREDHLVELNIKPDAYTLFQNSGVQIHAQLAVPKGSCWLRTGIYDRTSHKVGTIEIPLSEVKPLDTAVK